MMTDLVVRDLAKEIRALIEVGNGRVAEKYLLEIADENGDQALAPILAELNPLEWVSIMRDHSAGAPSALVDLLEPPQIAKAVQAEPLFWSDSLEKWDNTSFQSIAHQVREFLYSILTGEMMPVRRLEILEAIAESDAGMFFLGIPFWNFRSSSNTQLLEEFSGEEDPTAVSLSEDEPEDDEEDSLSGSEMPELDTNDKLFEIIRELNSSIAERLQAIMFDSFGDDDWDALKRAVGEVMTQAEALISDPESETMLPGRDVVRDMFSPVRKE